LLFIFDDFPGGHPSCCLSPIIHYTIFAREGSNCAGIGMQMSCKLDSVFHRWSQYYEIVRASR